MNGGGAWIGTATSHPPDQSYDKDLSVRQAHCTRRIALYALRSVVDFHALGE
jgi:hypothetical protein